MVVRATQILKGVTNKKQLQDWGAQQKMMKPPQNFIDSLIAYDKDNISDKQKADLKTPDLLNHKDFTYEVMTKKSSAAANLANWVINVVKYNDIYVVVEPLKKAAESSKALADSKGEELKVVQDRVAEIVAADGSTADAESLLKPLLSRHPNNAMLTTAIGKILLMKRQPAEARAKFKLALKQDPNALEARQYHQSDHIP